jgi:Flp pilus assembly protein TadG
LDQSLHREAVEALFCRDDMLMNTRQGNLLRREAGQSIVEFALILPFLVFLLFAIFQFGLAFHNYLAITDAARVGARAAAVHRVAAPGACPAARAAIQNTVSATQWGVISSRIGCSVVGAAGTPFTVTITYPVSIGLPGYFGLPAFSFTATMTGSATERLE